MYIPASKSATSTELAARLCASISARLSARDKSLVSRCASGGRLVRVAPASGIKASRPAFAVLSPEQFHFRSTTPVIILADARFSPVETEAGFLRLVTCSGGNADIYLLLIL